jgi:UDPglucose--hexose-1-phosphate uridylyltransferase
MTNLYVLGGRMELRKDPISQYWVIQEESEETWSNGSECPLCPGHEPHTPQTIYEHSNGFGAWQVRVTPHLRPLYRIEGDAQRRADGVYDRMRSLGAHEVVVEHPDHHLPLSEQTAEHVAHVLMAYVARLVDLKRDRRFRYVTVFRNQGELAGQDLDHPHSQITATPFIPRRVVYELRSFQRYYEMKERCLLCDIVKQELAQQTRTVEWDDQFVAFCPFASRVPYETWILPLNHHCSFEEDLTSWARQVRLARLLKSILRRLEAVAPAYQLVLHTSPNVTAKFDKAGHWQSLAEDFHWHFEILPVQETKSKSYGVKEVYYNSLRPELAAEELRKVGAETTVKG